MTIQEANKEIEKIDNEIEFWLNKKQLIIESTIYPKSGTGERVDGGKREDKYKHLDYAIDNIDPKLEILYKERNIYENFIENELKRLGKYNEIEKEIYNLRNDYDYRKEHNGKKRPWWQISNMIGYSERQCYRIYNKISGKRNDE